MNNQHRVVGDQRRAGNMGMRSACSVMDAYRVSCVEFRTYFLCEDSGAYKQVYQR